MARKVLIVEDNPLVARIWGARLQSSGFEVRTANNGGAARQVVAEWRPDAIVLDVVLPDADGLELCQEWKGHPATAGTKIIFVSAFATRKDVDAALAAGADGYLPKSADTATLLPGHVARYLEQGAAAVAGATGGVSSGL